MKYLDFLRNIFKDQLTIKNDAEIYFWKQEIKRYASWYNGQLPVHYSTNSPSEKEKVFLKNVKDSSIMTWANLHQKPKYLHDLELNPNAFSGKKVLDIGSGPIISAAAFEDCEIFALDPLWGNYLSAGFPIHYNEKCYVVCAEAESIPMADDSIDVIISANALDHVNDFHKSVEEIRRVLKPNGLLAIHLHYHKATTEEPIELNDEIITKAFSWCPNFKKIKETSKKFGWELDAGESFTLWKNF